LSYIPIYSPSRIFADLIRRSSLRRTKAEDIGVEPWHFCPRQISSLDVHHRTLSSNGEMSSRHSTLKRGSHCLANKPEPRPVISPILLCAPGRIPIAIGRTAAVRRLRPVCFPFSPQMQMFRQAHHKF